MFDVVSESFESVPTVRTMDQILEVYSCQIARLFGLPNSFDHIVIFDPASKDFEMVGISSFVSDSTKFRGGILIPPWF